MKKHLLLIAATLFTLTGFAQKEAFVTDLDKLHWATNRVMGMTTMAAHPDFSLIGGTFQTVGQIELMINNQNQLLNYDKLVYVSEKYQAVVQLIYVGDLLYGKNISYFYESSQSKEAEQRFDDYNLALSKNSELAFMMGMGHDEVYFKDEQFAAGKKRIYLAKRDHFDVWEGYTAFALNIPDMNNLENMNQQKGYWTFITIYNTFDTPISTKYKFPELLPPLCYDC